LVKRINGSLHNWNAANFEELVKRIFSEKPNWSLKIDNLFFRREYEHIYIKKGQRESGSQKLNEITILSYGEYRFGDWKIILSEQKLEKAFLLSKNKTNFPLYIRSREIGDYFYPQNFEGRKKIKNFFIDRKIPADKRNSVPIVLENERKIIAIGNYQMDKRFGVSRGDEKIIYLKLENEEQEICRKRK